MKDTLFKDKKKHITPFCFDDEVAAVFEDMLSRSIPGYGFMLQQLPCIFAPHLRASSRVYDLGCSLGGVSWVAAKQIHDLVAGELSGEVISVDKSQAMITRLQKKASRYSLPIVPICADVADISFKCTDLVALNFVLMFISKEKRVPLLARIFDALATGGMLLLSEKVHAENKLENEYLTKTYHRFKQMQGYCTTEIKQKQKALASVLITANETTHVQALKQAGFNRVYRWFSCWQFVSWVAIK